MALAPFLSLLVRVEESLQASNRPKLLDHFLALPAGSSTAETLHDALHNQVGVYPTTGPGETYCTTTIKWAIHTAQTNSSQKFTGEWVDEVLAQQEPEHAPGTCPEPNMWGLGDQ